MRHLLRVIAHMHFFFAGTFTLLGCLISLWHLTSHLRHYYKPDVQRRVMAVLWMVPIYSVTSWFSLVFPRLVTSFSLNFMLSILFITPSSVNHSLITTLICGRTCTVLLSTKSSLSFNACYISLLHSLPFLLFVQLRCSVCRSQRLL